MCIVSFSVPLSTAQSALDYFLWLLVKLVQEMSAQQSQHQGRQATFPSSPHPALERHSSDIFIPQSRSLLKLLQCGPVLRRPLRARHTKECIKLLLARSDPATSCASTMGGATDHKARLEISRVPALVRSAVSLLELVAVQTTRPSAVPSGDNCIQPHEPGMLRHINADVGQSSWPRDVLHKPFRCFMMDKID